MAWSEQQPCRVVVVDDQDGYRAMLRLVLGMEVDINVVGEASNGLTAIEAARELGPDVLLLDIAMPIMDGIEAIPGIREASPATRIVMLSGFGSEDVKHRAEVAGAASYVEKGVNPREIADAVRGIASRA